MFGGIVSCAQHPVVWPWPLGPGAFRPCTMQDLSLYQEVRCRGMRAVLNKQCLGREAVSLIPFAVFVRVPVSPATFANFSEHVTAMGALAALCATYGLVG